MKRATMVAKAMTSAPKTQKLVGFSLAVTAPDAFDATVRIDNIALSDSGKIPAKTKPVDSRRVVPPVDSSVALREEHRMARSQPNYNTLVPSPTKKLALRESFNDWDPAPINETTTSTVTFVFI